MFDQLDPEWSKPVQTKHPQTWEEWLRQRGIRAKEVYIPKASDSVSLLRRAYEAGVVAANAAKGAEEV